MAFTGKATYTAGSTLPESAEDVSDLVAIASPNETPLLDAIGDPARAAHSTIHEWIEDALLPNTDQINDSTYTNPLTDTQFVVDHADRFQVGDQVQASGSTEVLFVTAVDDGTNTLTVVRGYGGSTPVSLADNLGLVILGNAALEGDDASSSRFTSRTRATNYTQIFSATVEVSGSELAVQQVGVKDELDYQKAQRTRELLRDLENSVLNGRAPAATQQGSSTVRRTMRGIRSFISTNIFAPSVNGFPAEVELTEEQINLALREIWQNSNGQVDLIVVSGQEKRQINQFVATNRLYDPKETMYRDNVSIYESDFGICRVLLSRWVQPGTVFLLDSSRLEVMPLAGRSFQFKQLAATGDRETGQVIGEYTLELRNENAHGVIQGFTG